MGYRHYISNSMQALIETSRAGRLWAMQIMLLSIVFSSSEAFDSVGFDIYGEFSKFMRKLADVEEEGGQD